MSWGGWFLVWAGLTGEPRAIGPFLTEHTCRAAIANARAMAEEWGQDDWRLPPAREGEPDPVRCERRS